MTTVAPSDASRLTPPGRAAGRTTSPRVSVVMPVYNGERFIAEAVRSVFASTYQDFELLIIDDGSTDGSIAEARRAAADDPRLRVLTVPHGGVGAARNAALRAARGEFIANLDSDDAMMSYRLAQQVAYLDACPDCVAVAGRSLIVDVAGRPFTVTCRYFTHESIDASLLAGNGGAFGNDTAMFRAAEARRVGGYEAALRSTGEDHDLWLHLAEVGQLANMPVVYTRYRIHDANVSGGEGSAARRLPVTLDNLRRAYARRGIIDREPRRIPQAPLARRERLCDAALSRYYQDDRAGAVWRVLAAFVLDVRATATHGALRTILLGWPKR